MTRLIAVDPGKTTGFCIFDLNAQKKTAKLILASQATGVAWIDSIKMSENDIVVWEGYFIAGAQFDGSGIEVIGAVKYAAYLSRAHIIKQEPSTPNFVRKRYFGDKQPKLPQHSRDAYYHGIFYLSQKGWNSAVRELVKCHVCT